MASQFSECLSDARCCTCSWVVGFRHCCIGRLCGFVIYGSAVDIQARTFFRNYLKTTANRTEDELLAQQSELRLCRGFVWVFAEALLTVVRAESVRVEDLGEVVDSLRSDTMGAWKSPRIHDVFFVELSSLENLERWVSMVA